MLGKINLLVGSTTKVNENEVQSALTLNPTGCTRSESYGMYEVRILRDVRDLNPTEFRMSN